MKPSSKTPLIIGVAILIFTSLGLVGIGYTFYQNETAQEETPPIANDNDPLEQLKKEKNINTVPVTEPEGSSPGIDSDNQGIPTGTYSEPPEAAIGSSEPIDEPIESRPIDRSFDSSVERNRISQQRFDTATPDYNRPSSSNNFNRTNDNSLIDSLEDDEILENPITDTEDSIITPSLIESPLDNSN